MRINTSLAILAITLTCGSASFAQPQDGIEYLTAYTLHAGEKINDGARKKAHEEADVRPRYQLHVLAGFDVCAVFDTTFPIRGTNKANLKKRPRFYLQILQQVPGLPGDVLEEISRSNRRMKRRKPTTICIGASDEDRTLIFVTWQRRVRPGTVPLGEEAATTFWRIWPNLG